MISFQPVKDKAYTLDDILMKKGKRGQKQKQKQKQSVVIRNVININKKEIKRRPKPKPKTEKREIRASPSYSMPTGASGASFTPFTSPLPLYRNMTISAPQTTKDDITASQKRSEIIRTGNILNNIEQKTDKLNPLEKIEQVIINQNKPIIKQNDKEDGRPPSFEEAIGGVEYKTEDEADKIQKIKEQYERGLTLKNQKRREAYARKQLEAMSKIKGKIEELDTLQQDILAQAERMNKKLLEESQQRQQQEPEPEPEPQKKERKKREPKTQLEKDFAKYEKANKGISELERESVENVVLDTREAERMFNENMEKIRQSRQQDNSNPSDENMSSRVQSLKRGHITPMMPRYF